jgi:hypothetical protein
LGAEENVYFLGSEVAKGVAKSVLTPRGIGVEAGDFSGRKDFAENNFGLFGSVSLKANSRVLAIRAEAGHNGLKAADVTNEAFVAAVVGKRNGAVVALDDMSAGWALEGPCEATAVKKNDNLFIRFDAFFDRRAKDV